jgi:hypothetical protein
MSQHLAGFRLHLCHADNDGPSMDCDAIGRS